MEEVLQALPQEAAWGPRSRAVVQVATGDSRGEGLTVSREARGQGGMRSAQLLTSSVTFVSHAQATQRVPSVFNENVVLTPTGLISEEASGGAERGCRVVVTELLPPPPQQL